VFYLTTLSASEKLIVWGI